MKLEKEIMHFLFIFSSLCIMATVWFLAYHIDAFLASYTAI